MFARSEVVRDGEGYSRCFRSCGFRACGARSMEPDTSSLARLNGL